MRVRKGFLFLALVAGLLAGCQPLYLPPVPQGIEAPERLQVARDSALREEAQTLVLFLRFQRIPTSGWLALQWFDPRNREVASDSLWLEPGREGLARTVALPGRVPLEAGTWRVVLSFGGTLVRQFSTEVGPG